MPHYHQVQTYQRVEKASQIDVANAKFEKALKEIGCWNGGIKQYLRQFGWTEGQGFKQSEENCPWKDFSIGNVELNSTPQILGWSAADQLFLEKDWVECSLLFESDEIQNPHYSQSLWSGLTRLMNVLGNYFTDTGVYLTNEMQDGAPWEGLLEDDNEKIWNFDLAYVPPNLTLRYEKVPPTHRQRVLSGKIFYFAIEEWPSLT